MDPDGFLEDPPGGVQLAKKSYRTCPKAQGFGDVVQALAPLLKIRRVLKDLVLLFKAFELANYAWLAHSGDKEERGECLGKRYRSILSHRG